jgi:cephalosporin-C deacetylase-like acetyl esterase
MILGFAIGFILLTVLIGIGVYYSNVIVFPPRYGLSHIPEDWDIQRENLKNFECRDIEFRTKDQIMLKGWYLPAKVDARKAILLVHGYGVNRWKVFEQVPFLHHKIRGPNKGSQIRGQVST